MKNNKKNDLLELPLGRFSKQQYLSTKDLAELTGLSVRHIQRLAAAGKIPGGEWVSRKETIK